MDTLQEMITKEARLEQLAEECAELAQAALKLARKYRNENPTPKSEAYCLCDLTEEAADVMSCLEALTDLLDMDEVEQIRDRKTERWISRWKALKSKDISIS